MNMVASGASFDISRTLARLVLTNDLEELATLSDWVDQTVAEFGLAAKTAFAVELALTEAVTNVLSYAFPQAGQHQVLITLTQTETEVTAEIADDGQPFDPLEQAPVNLPGSLNEAAVGGLGIHLIRNYTSDCCYRRENGRNILTLTFTRLEA